MRVLILDTVYGAFLDSHYRSSPGLAAASYDEQWRALMDTHFATADAYSHNLEKAGVAAHEVVVDAAPLQQAWAREHGVDLEGTRSCSSRFAGSSPTSSTCRTSTSSTMRRSRRSGATGSCSSARSRAQLPAPTASAPST